MRSGKIAELMERTETMKIDLKNLYFEIDHTTLALLICVFMIK